MTTHKSFLLHIPIFRPGNKTAFLLLPPSSSSFTVRRRRRRRRRGGAVESTRMPRSMPSASPIHQPTIHPVCERCTPCLRAPARPTCGGMCIILENHRESVLFLYLSGGRAGRHACPTVGRSPSPSSPNRRNLRYTSSSSPCNAWGNTAAAAAAADRDQRGETQSAGCADCRLLARRLYS